MATGNIVVTDSQYSDLYINNSLYITGELKNRETIINTQRVTYMCNGDTTDLHIPFDGKSSPQSIIMTAQCNVKMIPSNVGMYVRGGWDKNSFFL